MLCSQNSQPWITVSFSDILVLKLHMSDVSKHGLSSSNPALSGQRSNSLTPQLHLIQSTTGNLVPLMFGLCWCNRSLGSLSFSTVTWNDFKTEIDCQWLLFGYWYVEHPSSLEPEWAYVAVQIARAGERENGPSGMKWSETSSLLFLV